MIFTSILFVSKYVTIVWVVNDHTETLSELFFY